MSSSNKDILVSFIVPVFNTGEWLYETLDSINNQTFDLSKVQVIIINDCSTDPYTNSLIADLKKTNTYKNLNLDIIENPKNMWLSRTRNIGVKQAKGEYLICLDSDDTIEPDFILLSYLVFLSHPDCSWVYPSLRKFGFRNQKIIVPDFSAKQLFLTNYSSVCSMMKKSLWDELKGQKTLMLSKQVKMYEDWDFWHRALRKGRYGVALKKAVFNYRQNINSLVTRSEEEGNMSILMAMRYNWTALFGIPFSQRRYNKNRKHVTKFSFIDRVFRKIIKKLTGRNPTNFKLMELLMYVFAPNTFLNNRLRPQNIRTKAHAMAGFESNFELSLQKNPLFTIEKQKKRVLITHFFWHIGGAENVLLDYVKTLHAQGYEIIDLVFTDQLNGNALTGEFEKYASRQYNLDHLSEFPYPKLLALWEIIQIEKPDILLNMSNPLSYLLLPELKKHYPEIKTLDLLHAEEFDNNGWFEGARPFQNYIDQRIVISDFWKQVLTKKYKEEESKIAVVPIKIDTEKFSENADTKSALREKHKLEKHQIAIGFLGRLHEPKQPEVIVELAKLLSHRDDLVFFIVGSGVKEDDLKKQAPGNLVFLPESKSPHKLLQLFDIGIFPSLFEGYPIVSLECASLNIPVIVPEIQGFKEQIQLGNFGELFPVNSIEDDAQYIANLIENNLESILSKGKNGRQFVTNYHASDAIDQKLISLF